MRARALLVAAAFAFGCRAAVEDPPAAPIVSPPHCTRPASGACDLESGRGDACVCTSDAQCASGFCGLETKYCGTVCRFRTFEMAIGDRCDCAGACGEGTRCLETCPKNAYCKDLGTERRCAPLEGPGAPCDPASSTCRAGLRCAAGICTEIVAKDAGASCVDDRDCKSGLFCRASKCEPRRKAGEPCDGTWLCETYASCDVACAAGTCCSSSTLGAKCTATPDCRHQGLYCSKIDGTCQRVRLEGEACDPADAADACVRDLLTRFSSTCDPKTRTCVGGYCR